MYIFILDKVVTTPVDCTGGATFTWLISVQYTFTEIK